MKIAYAFRRSIFYPYMGDSRGLPERPVRERLFTRVREIGFDGIELSVDMLGGVSATESQVREIREELEGYGTPCVVLRGGGGASNPKTAAQNRDSLRKVVEVAHWLEADIVI